jgi:hypothetical protein
MGQTRALILTRRCLPSAELSLATQKPINDSRRTIFPSFSKIDSEAYEKKCKCVQDVRSLLQAELKPARDRELEYGRVIIQISTCASDEEILRVQVEVSRAQLELLYSKEKGSCWSVETAFGLPAKSEGDPPEEKALFKFFSEADNMAEFLKEVNRVRKTSEKRKCRARARNLVRIVKHVARLWVRLMVRLFIPGLGL